jgi:WD40 repeat protein
VCGIPKLEASCFVSRSRSLFCLFFNCLPQVPNIECLSVIFSDDGKSIISGWSDGKIRGFKPQSGGLLFTINDAHRDGVTALVGTADSQSIISGGQDGQVRVWSISRNLQKLVATLKEHKGRINSLQLNSDNTECVSASDDGSCVIWNLSRYQRTAAMSASTQFKAISYHPDQSQFLTGGSDRKLTYWGAVDAKPIRVLDHVGSVSCMCINSTGYLILSGSDNKQVCEILYIPLSLIFKFSVESLGLRQRRSSRSGIGSLGHHFCLCIFA